MDPIRENLTMRQPTNMQMVEPLLPRRRTERWDYANSVNRYLPGG